MNTRTLGLIGMISSPFLAIDFFASGIFDNYQPTSLSGVFNLIYMTGWLCCIVALYRLRATGNISFGRGVLITQMILLSLGETWNLYAIIEPTANTILFRILDWFWPISNSFMFVTGLSVIAGKRLQGWRRYMPLVVGLWLPICLVSIHFLFGKTTASLYTTSLYSATAWFLLALAVYTSKREKVRINLEEAIPQLRTMA